MRAARLVAILLALAAPARAALVGKLDLVIIPQAAVVRDLQDGLWEIGGKLPFWDLRDSRTGDVWLQAFLFGVWRLELQDPAFGLGAGMPFSAVGMAYANSVAAVSNYDPSAPPWLKKAASYLSMDGYVGARPHYTPPDDHRVMYGFGFHVALPFGSLQSWAKGTPDIKDAGGNVVTPEVKGL